MSGGVFRATVETLREGPPAGSFPTEEPVYNIYRLHSDGVLVFCLGWTGECAYLGTDIRTYM